MRKKTGVILEEELEKVKKQVMQKLDKDFWGGGTVRKKVFLVYLALMILYRKC